MTLTADLLTDRLNAVLARPLVLVAGAPHAGYAATARMLDAHPDMRCAPDGHFTDRFAVGLKDLLADYNAGLETGAAAFTQADFVHLTRTAVGLALAKLAPVAAVRTLGCAVAVHAHNLDFWERMVPAIRVLHVVRDGRTATAAALDAVDAAPGSEAWCAAVTTAAYAWADATRTACAFGASRPERYHEVRWEDLLTDPHTHLAAALRFLDVRTDADAVAACLTRAPERTADRRPGGGPSDAGTLDAPPLDSRALDLVLTHQAPLLRQFGYLD